MGYLSQKKKQQRINVFLNISVFLIALFSISILSGSSSSSSHFVLWQFQYYLLILGVFVYSLFARYFIHAFFIGLFIIINYVSLSSSSNVFFNVEGLGSKELNVVYLNKLKDITPIIQRADADVVFLNPETTIPDFDGKAYRIFHDDANLGESFILSKQAPKRSGTVQFSPRQIASYITLVSDNHDLMLINIDFSKLKHSEESLVFRNFTKFILEQNVPIIVLGDFGIPSWSETFKKFLSDTDLEVKNGVILSDGNSRFDIFTQPSINVLGYKTLGLSEVKFLDKSAKNAHYPLLFKLVP